MIPSAIDNFSWQKISLPRKLVGLHIYDSMSSRPTHFPKDSRHGWFAIRIDGGKSIVLRGFKWRVSRYIGWILRYECSLKYHSRETSVRDALECNKWMVKASREYLRLDESFYCFQCLCGRVWLSSFRGFCGKGLFKLLMRMSEVPLSVVAWTWLGKISFGTIFRTHWTNSSALFSNRFIEIKSTHQNHA